MAVKRQKLLGEEEKFELERLREEIDARLAGAPDDWAPETPVEVEPADDEDVEVLVEDDDDQQPTDHVAEAPVMFCSECVLDARSSEKPRQSAACNNLRSYYVSVPGNGELWVPRPAGFCPTA
jgi:hypothetical protein